MLTRPREDFLTHLDWFESVIDENIILCGTSALECLQRFIGYRYETDIYAYTVSAGKYENINYTTITNFDDIEYTTIRGIRCTTFQQTINDMLADFHNTDEIALAEALSDYYYEHNESFDGLTISSNNKKIFMQFVENAINYYGG